MGRQRCGRLYRLEATVVGFPDLKQLALRVRVSRRKTFQDRLTQINLFHIWLISAL
nr:hypothetical protein [Aulosira sp. DedVER01a]